MLEISEKMKSSSFLQIWVLVLVNVLAICMAQDYTFVVEESDHSMLCTNVTTMKINGTIPGPALNLTFGQTVTVNVINNANHGLTIHWHGVKQPRNPWSDGPEYVTQCPIKPGSNFTYEIILSDEEGTLWWHAHSDWSRATVYGPIFIHPAQERPNPYPIQPDAEQEIILGTWFQKDVMEIVHAYRENGTTFDLLDALTINGQPGDIYNNVNDVGCTPGMFEMEVEFNKTYLLRIINAAMNEDLAFAVAGHNLTVVGTDAAYIEPIETDTVMIFSGQTMDVLLVADKSPAYYYMEAKYVGLGSTFTTTGLIKYSNTDITTRTHPDLPDEIDVAAFTGQFRALNNSNYPIDVPQTVNTTIFMTVSLNKQACDANQPCEDGTKAGASLSNVTFVEPEVDVLQAYYLNMSSFYKTDFPMTSPVFDYTNASGLGTFAEVNGTRVFVVDYNSTVEMVFQGTNVLVPPGVAHPMHVHGYSFYSVAWGLGNFNASNVTYNLVNPPLINTFALPANGWTAIRFRADNPGVWFMHCHLDRHAFTGMDAVMIVKNGTTANTSMLPPPFTPTGTCS